MASAVAAALLVLPASQVRAQDEGADQAQQQTEGGLQDGQPTENAAAGDNTGAVSDEGDPKVPDQDPPAAEVEQANQGLNQEGVAAAEPAPVEEKPENVDPNTGQVIGTVDDPVAADPAKTGQLQGELGQTGVNSVQTFYNALSPYGSWFNDPQYGRVWYPNPNQVGANFTPYTRGSWAYTPAGYYFKSEFPQWGWATDHFGRWYQTSDSPVGWAWVPGTDWAPAHVLWRRGYGRIGWAPLPPNYNYASPTVVPYNWWNFATARTFFNPYVYRYLAGNNYRLYYYNTLPLAVGFRYYNGVGYYYGPRWGWLRGYYPTYRPYSLLSLYRYYPAYRSYLVRRAYYAPRFAYRYGYYSGIRFNRVYGARLAPVRSYRPAVSIRVNFGGIRPGVRVGYRPGVRVGVGVRVSARTSGGVRAGGARVGGARPAGRPAGAVHTNRPVAHPAARPAGGVHTNRPAGHPNARPATPAARPAAAPAPRTLQPRQPTRPLLNNRPAAAAPRPARPPVAPPQNVKRTQPAKPAPAKAAPRLAPRKR